MENTIVCLTSYYKGYDFIDECKKLGNKVILITSEGLKEKPWPWHAIDEVYYMPEIQPYVWNLDHLISGFSYLMKSNKIDAVVALDDFDVEKAALIRETFRIPGMGQTTHRYFRDKLAMRGKAQESGLYIPPFTAVFNDQILHEFTQNHSAPWVLKPRSEASATGIKKINSAEELWEVVNSLGDFRHQYLLEVYKPGDVFHVDSLTYKGKVIFTSCSQYLAPPMDISHHGGVFRTKTLHPESQLCQDLHQANAALLKAFGMVNGATHTEFIKSSDDGKIYFLETSSRVGGANIPEMVEASTGINIWREWAKIEAAIYRKQDYTLQESPYLSAGLIMALSKEQYPDITDYQTEEFYKNVGMDYHIGLVYRSASAEKIQELLDDTANKIIEKHLHIIPPKEKINE